MGIPACATNHSVAPKMSMQTRFTVRHWPMDPLRVAKRASFWPASLHSPRSDAVLCGTSNRINAEVGSETAVPRPRSKPGADPIICHGAVAGVSLFQDIAPGRITQDDIALGGSSHRRRLHPLPRVLNQPAMPLRPP
jgi:hypothetical protein